MGKLQRRFLAQRLCKVLDGLLIVHRFLLQPGVAMKKSMNCSLSMSWTQFCLLCIFFLIKNGFCNCFFMATPITLCHSQPEMVERINRGWPLDDYPLWNAIQHCQLMDHQVTNLLTISSPLKNNHLNVNEPAIKNQSIMVSRGIWLFINYEWWENDGQRFIMIYQGWWCVMMVLNMITDG